MATIYDRQQQQAKVLLASQHKALVPTNEFLSLSILQNSLHHEKRKVYTSCSATRQERQTFLPGQCTQKVWSAQAGRCSSNFHRYQGGVCHMYSKDGLVFMKRLQLSVQLSVSSALQYYFGTTNTECLSLLLSFSMSCQSACKYICHSILIVLSSWGDHARLPAVPVALLCAVWHIAWLARLCQGLWPAFAWAVWSSTVQLGHIVAHFNLAMTACTQAPQAS